MRWVQVITVAAGLAGALALREPEGLGQCNKSCLPEKRDASGCCPAPPKPAPTAAPQPQPKPAPKGCAVDEHASAGHCCKAGEEWVPSRGQCVCLDAAACGAAAAPAPTAGTCPAGMVLIPGGSFMMELPVDKTQHRVSVSAFCLDKTEVTVAECCRSSWLMA
jgi:formylglycine-generating enzyme required for sulfatase activity